MNNLSFADTNQLELKRHKIVFQLNGTKKQAGLAILIFENIDFKLKLKKRQRMIPSIHQAPLQAI